MCTLILLDRVQPGVQLIAASNRDEYLSRPAAAPALIRRDGPDGIALIAPQDLQAGGTWMGVNSKGLFVGLTNRPDARKDPARRSRGLLVMDLLARRSAQEAARELGARTAERPYNPFHLICADGNETFAATLREDGPWLRPLDPGIHVLANRDLDDPEDPKVQRIRARLDAMNPGASVPEVVGGLRAILATHAPVGEPLDGVCTHAPGYGTRSSGVFVLGEARWQFWYADGPPCETKYQDLSPMLEELRHA